MPAHILACAKAYATLVGAVATALLGIFTRDSTVGNVLTIVVAVATAVATYAVPNTAALPTPIADDGPSDGTLR